MILFSQVYCFFSSLHRCLFALGLKKQIKIQKKVISVGNLTFGGTGKTPFVKMLIDDLQSLGLKPALVTRSYKATSSESSLMDQGKSLHPEIWGDEACWYFNKLRVPIYSGPSKWQSALLAEKNLEVDVVVIDDGFQHHRLFRDHDIVLIDAVAGVKGLKSHSRESWKTLKFADTIVITRANLAAPENLIELQKMIPENKSVFLNFTTVESLRDFAGREVTLRGTAAGLVSGIANPLSFRNLFSQSFPEFQIKTLEFSDHHHYKLNDLKRIEKFKKEHHLDTIVVTEKDEIKLKNLVVQADASKQIEFAVLQIESRFDNQMSWIARLKGAAK